MLVWEKKTTELRQKYKMEQATEWTRETENEITNWMNIQITPIAKAYLRIRHVNSSEVG